MNKKNKDARPKLLAVRVGREIQEIYYRRHYLAPDSLLKGEDRSASLAKLKEVNQFLRCLLKSNLVLHVANELDNDEDAVELLKTLMRFAIDTEIPDAHPRDLLNDWNEARMNLIAPNSATIEKLSEAHQAIIEAQKLAHGRELFDYIDKISRMTINAMMMAMPEGVESAKRRQSTLSLLLKKEVSDMQFFKRSDLGKRGEINDAAIAWKTLIIRTVARKVPEDFTNRWAVITAVVTCMGFQPDSKFVRSLIHIGKT